MKYLLNSCTQAHWNMAFDEFVLEKADFGECVFYLWQNAPAVIIGLNQSAYSEVDLQYLRSNGIVLARRVTGGGAVYHDLGNLNYSFAGPSSLMEGAEGWMSKALKKLGLNCERSGRNDILVDGRKCSGYAKRLSKDRMMVHGTLMWDVDLDVLTKALAVPGSKLQAAGIASVRSRVANLKDYLPAFGSLEEFRSALHSVLADGDSALELSGQQLKEISQECETKFGSWDWNFGHSPAASFASSKKFLCGSVTARYNLRHGLVEKLVFEGDFIGLRPAGELAPHLEGLPPEKLPEALAALPVGLYFDGMSPEELSSLFI